MLDNCSLLLFQSSKLNGLSIYDFPQGSFLTLCSSQSQGDWPRCFQMKGGTRCPIPQLLSIFWGVAVQWWPMGLLEQTTICVLRPSLFWKKELALVPAVSHQLSDHLPLLKNAICLSSLQRASPTPLRVSQEASWPHCSNLTILAAHITAGGVGSKPHTNFPPPPPLETWNFSQL